MKNLRKVLALVVALTMVISVLGMTTAFAAYTDVSATASFAEAVAMNSSLGLLKGYEDGTFKPDADITRAEFAAVVDRALGLEDASNGAKGATAFTDVPADLWSSGYINLGTQQGFIKGYGDGKFGPSDNVTYEQAIKMIVAAMGYTPKAESLGGYPGGYLVIAAQLGITDGTSASTSKASRGTVARLIYNALDDNLMEQTSFGKTPEWAEVNKSLLTDKLKVKKVEGIVTENYASNLTIKTAADKKVKLDLSSVVKYVTVNNVSVNVNLLSGSAIQDVKVGASNAADYLGNAVVAFVKDFDDSAAYILAIAPKVGKNTELVIPTENLDSFVTQASSTDDIKYWVNKTDEKTTTVNILKASKVVVNGSLALTSPADLSTYVGTAVTPRTSGSLKLLDNNNDGVYEYAFITKYADYVVQDVTSKGKVADKLMINPVLDLDKDSTNYKFTITMDGTAIAATDLKEWDVLSVSVSKDNQLKTVIGTRNKITNGNITEIMTKNPPIDTEYTVSGKVYKLAADFLATGPTALKIDKTGTFYLNAFAKIAYFDTTANSGSASYQYGFLFNAARNGGIDNAAQLRIYTSKGEWKTYNVASKVKIDDVQIDTKSAALVSLSPSNFNLALDGTLTALVKQLVAYEVDATDSVKTLKFAPTPVSTIGYSDYTSYKPTSGVTVVGGPANSYTVNYKAASKQLGNILITAQAKIFNVDDTAVNGVLKAITEDDVKIVTGDVFKDANMYTINTYDVEAGPIANAIVAHSASNAVPEEGNFFLVDSISTAKDASGNDIIRIYGYEDGATLTTLTTVDTTKLVVKDVAYTAAGVAPAPVTPAEWKVGAANAANPTNGSIIQYNKDGNGNIDKINVVYRTGAVIAANVVGNYISVDTQLVFGEVLKKTPSANSIQINAPALSLNTFSYSADTKVMKYDYVNNKVVQSVGIADVSQQMSTVPVTPGSTVFFKVYKDAIKQIFILN